ncbi:hypothetical protein [Devosia sp.]|uniref:hypothetical protein n=1 Tax=Devosia sp. TaxID=1871048 RepID=UPI002FC94CCF
MTRLPDIIDLDEMDHPELIRIFRGIDAGITELVASDPTFRPKPASKRRPGKDSATGTRRRASQIQQAA